ncbi:LLM class flavin-dependent oxidoreductase [Dactylosporangium sp. NPDC051541]|uniref:LLM class flavin-dependent oxidoreductase n=1 Tax=Dactylosporangium sp. NPDC051541 TaxID=3363977 RepID=UPI0037B54149
MMHLNAFLMSSGHHEAAWRLPESDPYADVDVRHWVNLARIAERGKLDSLFLADGPALLRGIEFRPTGQLEPTILLAILAAATSHIGLIATASTTYNEPYNLARRFASLDHVSGGRAGWNIVTTAGRDAARNFGLGDRPDHLDRYRRATEFVEVSRKLWDSNLATQASWGEGSRPATASGDDARVADKARGRYVDPAKVRAIGHRGEYYRVEGALNVPRPPQGHPLLVQAGSSGDGKDFAARYADAVFTAQQTLADAQQFYADLKARVALAGRDPATVKILPGIVPILGSTEAEAQRKAQELEDLIVPEFGLGQLSEILEVPVDRLVLDAPLPDDIPDSAAIEGAQSRSSLIVNLARRERLTVRQLIGRLGGGRGHWTFIGTPEQTADVLEEWFESGAADGFNVMGAALPSGLEDFVDQVVPILRARGLFRTDYEGRTLREHYGLTAPSPVPAR